MSTVKLPLSLSCCGVNTYAMERDTEIEEIKERMRLMGYNPRSLSMELFGNPDRLQNLFSGKTRNLRSDAYKKVVAKLWPEGKGKAPAGDYLRDFDQAVIRAIQSLIMALAARGIRIENDLETLFAFQRRDFLARNQLGAAEVMDQLLNFVQTGLHQSIPQANQRSEQPSPDQSKKAKT